MAYEVHMKKQNPRDNIYARIHMYLLGESSKTCVELVGTQQNDFIKSSI